MLNNIFDWYVRNTRGWLVLVLLVLDMAFAGFIMPLAGAYLGGDNIKLSPIDLLFFYTPETAYNLVEAYGEYGRPFYRNVELSLDIVYPIIYTLFFGMAITWFAQRAFSKDNQLQRLNLLPLGAWVFDMLENVGIVTMLSIFPAQPAALAWATTIFTMTKWIFAGSSVVALVLSMGAFLLKKFR